MLKRLSLSAVLVLAGCSSSSGPYLTNFPIRHIDGFREFRLSRDHDTDPGTGVRLIFVQADGTTTIEVRDSGDKYEAKPGQYFPGFGTVGLQLISASPEQCEVVLRRSWGKTLR